MMIQQLIMMVGLPGSGKSTIANKIAEHFGDRIHSSDSIRKELYGTEDEQGHNEEVFNLLYKRIREDLLAGLNVIFDATNVTKKSRMNSLNSIFNNKEMKALRKTILVQAKIVVCSFNECIERDHARERTVGSRVIEKFYRTWQTPVLEEGFDRLFLTYTSEAVMANDDDVMEELVKIPQFNHWHTMTIGEHCISTGIAAFQKKADRVLYFAGRYHDVGKKFCMQFRDSKGRITTDAHFFNHESVSAYDSLTLVPSDFTQEQALLVSQLITYHMMPHFLEEKGMKKNERFFSREFWEYLMILHEADKEGR